MSTSQKFKYPYTWGRDQVNPFVEKYDRGTRNLANICEASVAKVRHGLIVVLCSGSSLRFESLKALIKALDQHPVDYVDRLSSQERKLLYKYYLYYAEDGLILAKNPHKALDIARQEELRF